MAKIIRPRKTILNPDQIPMLTPDSPWRAPTELPDLSKIDVVAIDTEEKDDGLAHGRGPGWAFGSGYISGVSAAWRTGDSNVHSVFVPIAHPDSNNFPKDNVARWVRHIYDNCRVVFCNAAFDIGWIDCDFRIPPPSRVNDIGCMAMMIDENRRQERGVDKAYSLDGISNWLGLEGKDESLLLDAAISYGFRGRAEVKKNLYRIPARYVGPYAEQDAVATLTSFEIMEPRIDADGMRDAYQTEMDLVPLIHYMRKRGIRLDVDGAEALRDDLYKRRDQLLAELHRRLPGTREITMRDIRSHDWLLRTCEAEGVRVPMAETDASKRDSKYSGDDPVLRASFKKDWMRADEHWLPRFIAEAKQCEEAASKFVQGYLLDFAHRGRVHATINQYMSEDGGTRSHRFSYADPPLQQMPSRPDPVPGWDLTEKIAKALRGVIMPEEGELWFAPDYSQQEYRLIVHYASLLDCDKAEDAVAKYNNDPKTDFHNLVVDLTGLTRRRAKDCNFAKAYGAGVPKFAIMTGMSLEEAAKTMGQYDEEMPFVKQLNDKCSKSAQSRGWIKLLDGARSHFDDWEAAFLTKEERSRGWREGRLMYPCRIDEARERTQDPHHPWYGKRLKRAMAHKAMNRLIQGGAARQVKKAMVACWREKLYPLIQIHDELGFSLSSEKVGMQIGEIMREVVKLRVPMRVDEEYGISWGTAKLPFAEAAEMAGLAKPKKKTAPRRRTRA